MQRSAVSGKLDSEGYRPNVAIVVCNASGKVLWARRTSRDGWQFPQGGVERDETAEDAAFRELYEEVGLGRKHVRLVGRTQSWLKYDVPRFHLSARRGQFRGQKQLWFLFELIGTDTDVRLDRVSRPEFDRWRWVDYWDPVERIVDFKRHVYQRALAELEPFVVELKSEYRVVQETRSL
ncbi:MAG: RNA pyrophosphohydrolase [Proteobacteria bacterium]|nr:MAG: RNA pyrophosphohydrolase [Pseudomonadota bacterium]